ncbi:MAG: tyrosine-type recombinase/integrase [Oscillospiraceae bacterium]|jgi:site-specific recombinase XerD|nr:tyrosine-type recombinase/integrase [Oscillospiraceae bacterium]
MSKGRNRDRVVPLNGNHIELLEKQLVYQRKERLRMGSKWIGGQPRGADECVFLSHRGTIIANGPFNIALHKICVKYGFTHTSMHGLRHSYITELLYQGVDPKTISRLVGHANISITLENLLAHGS